MRTIMARSPHDLSLSLSHRYFKWVLKKPTSPDDPPPPLEQQRATTANTPPPTPQDTKRTTTNKKKKPPNAASHLLAALRPSPSPSHLGSRVTGTLFGNRRGHVRLSFQVDPKSPPVFLIELATSTSGLVREMASGLVRVALECQKTKEAGEPKATPRKLLEEDVWRTYCNGRKCGYAVCRRELGDVDREFLRAVEPVSMGAGVLPVQPSGEVMYMRARFERVVGSRESEAFYMINPDGNGAGVPELSIYLLRL